MIAKPTARYPRSGDDLYALWREALTLGDASWIYGNEYRKNQIRNSDCIERSKILRQDLEQDLIIGLAAGDFFALGMQTSPKIGSGPEIIPRYLFSDKPTIDWNKSVLRSFGHIYEGVRVIELEQSTADQQDEAAPVVEIGITVPPRTPQKRMGRPPIGGVLREIVLKLIHEGELHGVSRKEQVNRIRVRAQLERPDLFPTASQPSRTKILEALKSVDYLTVPGDRPESPESP